MTRRHSERLHHVPVLETRLDEIDFLELHTDHGRDRGRVRADGGNG